MYVHDVMLMKENHKKIFTQAKTLMVHDLNFILRRYIIFKHGGMEPVELFTPEKAMESIKSGRLKSVNLNEDAAAWYYDAEPFMVSASLSVKKDGSEAKFAMAEIWHWSQERLEKFRKLYYANYGK